jgi:hypothetical protein
MNGFERHNLKHTSPSQINMWSDDPSAWVARYLFNKKFTFGVAPMIGTLTEKVVANVLCGFSLEVALAGAKSEFNRQTAIGFSEKDRARIDDIEAMALQALEILKPYGEPEFLQKITGREQQKIELLCRGAGWELPVIGFLDFVYPKEGLIIDLKTTMRCPSEMSVSHARQAAVYSKAKGDMACKMLYVTPKKSALYGVDDVNAVLAEVKTILTRQEAFLRLHDRETIQRIVPINAASFYWNTDSHIRRELYGV